MKPNRPTATKPNPPPNKSPLPAGEGWVREKRPTPPTPAATTTITHCPAIIPAPPSRHSRESGNPHPAVSLRPDTPGFWIPACAGNDEWGMRNDGGLGGRVWIPAFAGMTDKGAGMTNKGAGKRKPRLCASITPGSIRLGETDGRRGMMNEFLSGFGGGPVWAVFVLGVVAAAALALTAFWSGVGRLLGGRRRAGRRPTPSDDAGR